MTVPPRDDDNEGFSSPACYMHEFADQLVPPPPRPTAAPDWQTVKQWRKATRTELLSRRLAVPLRERQARAERAKAQLGAAVDLNAHRSVGWYWPIRGEMDVRDLAARHVEAGGVAALPVVVAKNSPVEFWRWQPGMEMRRGFWDIPVPAVREIVVPDLLVVPLVGFDSAGFRLGYGGGYYDRTLAGLTPRPFRVGLGYALGRLVTIHPQPHDVPMSLIVTEEGRVTP
jgi:5-formyltetrahydrofolate cyclo-ligase